MGCPKFPGRSRYRTSPGNALHASPPPSLSSGVNLSRAEREFLEANLRCVFTEKVARSTEAARVIALSIDHVFGQAPLTTSDAHSWHLMARALGSDKIPADFGLDPHPRSPRVKGDGDGPTGG